jgi:rhodanese-related sulfurtransferase
MNTRVQGPDGKSVENLSPEQVKAGLEAGTIALVDVREPNENLNERIPGDVLEPLSTFDPGNLPDPAGKRLVFYCRSGNRSVKSSLIAQAAGLPYDAHLAGGILAWKAAGFETESG